MIEFREITKENVVAICDLKLFEDQIDQVAPNSFSIAQGHYSNKAWFRGIYNDDEPVGFVMLSLDYVKNKFWVWRFMIDKNHQNKGYGRASIELIKQVIAEKVSDTTAIYLSYVPKEKGGANEFYNKVGFKDTGKMLGDEKIMVYKY